MSRRKRIGANLPLARLHAQMALLCQAEADRIAVPHQWPPRPALSAREADEVAYLDALGREAAGRVLQLAPDRAGAFADFAFGYDAEPGRPS